MGIFLQWHKIEKPGKKNYKKRSKILIKKIVTVEKKIIFLMIFVFIYLSKSTYTPTDPLYDKQFGLKNSGQFYGISREDIRTERVWNDKIFGKNIPIAVISDGCYSEHSDLAPNFDLEHSWNYYSWQKDPNHLNSSVSHRGTDFAGIISASGNEICTIGVAPEAKISCFNIENENRTAKNVLDSITRGNDYFRVKLLGTLERCGKICEHKPLDEELHAALLNAPDTVNFVTPAGADAFLGGDTNFFPVSRDPRVIVVSDSNHRGAHSSWSNRGTSILVNAPVGGSSSFDTNTFPSMPGLGVESPTSCQNEVNPIGAGAAYAAGAIALALEANSALKWRDVQALLAVTSTINNPNHHSWTKNGAGYYYSHFYGFGRIDADLLISAAKKWTNLPTQASISITKDQQHNIPTMNNGSVDIEFTVNKSILFTEYVTVSVSIDVIDASLLRFQLTSPKGTMFNIKATSISNDNRHVVNLLYTVRGYFGEDATGTWKLHVISDSIGPESHLYNATLSIFGISTKFSIPHMPQEKGNNPYTVISETMLADVKIKDNSVSCRSDFQLNITGESSTEANASMYLGTIDRKHRWPLNESLTITNKTVSIDMNLPCFFSDKERFNLIVEDMKTGVWGEVEVAIYNTEKDLILLNPTRYEVFRCLSEDPKSIETNIDIVPAMQMRYWLDGSFGQRARVTILDMDSGDFVFREDVNMKNQISIHFNGSSCPRCLLSVVPSWHDDMHDCLTMLQPISIISYHEDPPQKWIIPLTDKCPIPPGVFTPTPTPEPTQSPSPSCSMSPAPSPTFDDSNGKQQNKSAILTGSIFICVYGICLFIFICLSSRGRKGISDQPLL